MRPEVRVFTLFMKRGVLMGIGVLVLWSRGILPSERLVAQFHHGMAVMLSMVVTDESRARVMKRLRAAERVLQALGPLGS